MCNVIPSIGWVANKWLENRVARSGESDYLSGKENWAL